MSPFVEMFCSEFSQSPVFTLFASCAPHVLCARYDGEVVNEYQLSEATHIISEAPVVRSTCVVGFLCPCVCACAVVMICRIHEVIVMLDINVISWGIHLYTFYIHI